MAQHPDVSPYAGKKNSGKKNNDGREGPKEAGKPKFNDKLVYDSPNEGAPELSKKGVIGRKV